MNISFYILLLFIVSTYAGKLQPKRLGSKETKRHVDSGIGASGIQSSSSVNSANVETLPISSLLRKTRSTSNPHLRTLLIKREREICFSQFPIMMCEQGANASKTESKTVGLVCLDVYANPFAQLLASQVEKRIITEVMDLEKTETYTYDSPTKCSN